MYNFKIMICYLLAVSCYLFQACSENSNAVTLNNTTIAVEAEQIKRANGGESFSYSGTIEESETIPLSFSVVGNVSRVLVSEGDFVKKGQLLATLNNETYKNAYEMSLALQIQAEDAHKRLTPMYKNGSFPEIKYVEVETALQQAKAAASISKKNLDDCKLYSPVDGVIGKCSIDPGISAMPNLSSITIVKIEKVFALVSVSENEISSIKKGNTAAIKIAALDNSDFSGTVEEIGVLADPIAHTYKIKIGITNKNRLIKPGMICSVILSKSGDTPALFVPAGSVLVDEQGKNFVYAVYQNKAVKKYVSTGKLLKNGVEIKSGLSEGELIVTSGQQKIVNNSFVRIVNR